MTAMTIQHFDALDYVEQSTALGVNENVAKYQARQIERAIDIAINTARTDIENKELATKQDIKNLELNIKELDLKIEQVKADLELKIEQVKTEVHRSKFDIVIWVAGLFVASGLIQHFFK